MDMNPLELDRQLCFALYSASRAMTATYRGLLKQLGITYPQYLVMLVLWEQNREAEGITVKDLGTRLQLDSGTLSPLLSRLETLGYVSRERSAEDSRQVFVRTTAEGIAARAHAECVPQELGELMQIDPGDLAELVDTLHSLTDRLRGTDEATAAATGT